MTELEINILGAVDPDCAKPKVKRFPMHSIGLVSRFNRTRSCFCSVVPKMEETPTSDYGTENDYGQDKFIFQNSSCVCYSSRVPTWCGWLAGWMAGWWVTLKAPPPPGSFRHRQSNRFPERGTLWWTLVWLWSCDCKVWCGGGENWTGSTAVTVGIQVANSGKWAIFEHWIVYQLFAKFSHHLRLFCRTIEKFTREILWTICRTVGMFFVEDRTFKFN